MAHDFGVRRKTWGAGGGKCQDDICVTETGGDDADEDFVFEGVADVNGGFAPLKGSVLGGVAEDGGRGVWVCHRGLLLVS